jgi:ribosomal protein L37E
MIEPAIQLRLDIGANAKVCTRCFDQSWRVPRKIGECQSCGIKFAPEKIERQEIRRSGPLAELLDGDPDA